MKNADGNCSQEYIEHRRAYTVPIMKTEINYTTGSEADRAKPTEHITNKLR